MKICVIGNSHVGSLKRAWDLIAPSFSEIKLTFFAHRAEGLSGLRIDEEKLVAGDESLKKALEFTSGGSGKIDPVSFDCFLLYGLGAQSYFKVPSVFSEQVINASFNDVARHTLSFQILILLREITDKPIYIGHTPLKAAVKNKNISDNVELYLEGISMINDGFYQLFDAKLVHQPCVTIVNGGYTNIDYTKSSKRLAVGYSNDDELHPGHEVVHMNDVFGRIWLEEFISLI